MLFGYRTDTGTTSIYKLYETHIACFEVLFSCWCLPKNGW